MNSIALSCFAPAFMPDSSSRWIHVQLTPSRLTGRLLLEPDLFPQTEDDASSRIDWWVQSLQFMSSNRPMNVLLLSRSSFVWPAGPLSPEQSVIGVDYHDSFHKSTAFIIYQNVPLFALLRIRSEGSQLPCCFLVELIRLRTNQELSKFILHLDYLSF